MRRRPVSILFTLVALASACVWASAPGVAASGGTVVSATVPSATDIDPAGCSPAAMDLGVVLPGDPARTDPCVIGFGSSNDAAKLRLRQLDGYGKAMHGWPHGELDDTLAGNGSLEFAPSGTMDRGLSVEVDSQRRIVTSGVTNYVFTGGDSFVARHLPNGAPDPSFAGGMIATSASNEDAHYDVVVEADDSVTLVGMEDFGAGGGVSRVQRYLEDGSPDLDWGPGGKRTYELRPTGDDVLVTALRLDDGDLLAAGYAATAFNVTYGLVARFDPDGSLDSDFGTGGIATFNPTPSRDTPRAIAVMDDGRIVVSGVSEDAGDWFVVRLEPDGDPDPTFATAGTFIDDTIPGQPDNVFDVDVDEAGHVYVPVFSLIGTAADDIIVVQLDEDGDPAGGWGSSGISTIDLGGQEAVVALTLLDDGRANVLGYVGPPGNATTMLGRLLADGSFDASFDDDGYVTTTSPALGTSLTSAPDGQFVSVATLLDATGDLVIHRWDAETVPNYDGGADSWSTSMFGVCLESVGPGASPTWTPSTCPMSNDPTWHAVPSAMTEVAERTTTGGANVTATLRFGFRPADSLRPGRYLARVEFEVVAP